MKQIGIEKTNRRKKVQEKIKETGKDKKMHLITHSGISQKHKTGDCNIYSKDLQPIG